MIRYNYQQQLQPPAPFVNVTLRNPITGTELRDVPAQVDSAADRTLLPDSLVQKLDLPQIGAICIGGVEGSKGQSSDLEIAQRIADKIRP